MTTGAPQRARRPSKARERLLETASGLFYAEGINTVGVDRIVSASEVTLATFYRHFPSKQELAVAYLRRVHDQIAAGVAALAERAEGRELLEALGAAVASDLERPGYRGCAFIKAASEFEDAESPVRRAVAEHRGWYRGVVEQAFADAGHRDAPAAAGHFVMLRDGAMVAGDLDGAAAAKRTFLRGVGGLIETVGR